MGGSMLKKAFLLSIFAVFFSAGVFSAPIGPNLGLVDYIDMGEASSTISFSGGENTTLLDEARVTELPVTSNPLGVWETVDLEPASRDVETYLNTSDSDSSLIYPAEVNANISGLESGEYAIFFWSCQKNSTSNCKWLKPRKFTKPGGSSAGGCNPEVSVRAGKDDVLREEDTGTYRAIVNDCPNGVEQYRWEATRGDEVLGDSDGWSRSDEFSLTLPYMELEESDTFNVTVEARTRAGVVSETTQMWATPDIPEDILISAHRGSYHGPHNTVMTMEQARKAGVNSVEYDVWRTEDGKYVVRHDRWTGKYSPDGIDIKIPDSNLEELTGISVGGYYPPPDGNGNYEVNVDQSTAREERIASLDEILNYVQNYDLHQRIEFKGDLRKNQDWGEDIYEKVRNRDMLRQTVFMSFRGTCGRDISVLNAETTHCDWQGLQGVENAAEEEGNERRTTIGMLYANRGAQKPNIDFSGPGDVVSEATKLNERVLQSADKVTPSQAIGYASENGFDIIVAADGSPKGYAAGLNGSTQMSRGEFVDEVRDEGLRYSFMYFRSPRDMDKKKHMIKCGVEWVSTNRAMGGVGNVAEYNEGDLNEDPSYCDFEGEHEVNAKQAGIRTFGRAERAGREGLEFFFDGGKYISQHSYEAGRGTRESLESLWNDPSTQNFVDESQEAYSFAVEKPWNDFNDRVTEDGATLYSGMENTYGDWDEATQSQQDYVVNEVDQTVNDPEGQLEDTVSRANDGKEYVEDEAHDVACEGKWSLPC